MHSGMSLFSGRQPLDTAVMAQKAEALRCDALWRGEHASLPVQSFPPALGSSEGSISAMKVFHRCGSRSSMAISHAANRGRACLPSLLLSQRTHQQLCNISRRLFPLTHLTHWWRASN